MKRGQRLPYKITVLDQLTHWTVGQFEHNAAYDECCPDFACCNPNVQTSYAERREYFCAYMDKNKRTAHMMLGGFLAGALADKNVHIADGESEINPTQ